MFLGGAPGAAQSPATTHLSATRIVHRFDFAERSQGNLEPLPKYWEPLRPDGFPHYAGGGFDETTGYSSPPSLHLNSEGRNVAFLYSGPDIRIRAKTEYRIEGFLRPDRLDHARACLSAHYVDRNGQPLPRTLVRSRYLGSQDAGNDWVRVDLYLEAAPLEAHAIGLTAWVLQEPIWNPTLSSARHIPRRDVFGGAWFDDITIFALPFVQLQTASPGNVLGPDDPKEFLITLADPEDLSLHGELTIRDAWGRLLATHEIPVDLSSRDEPKRIPEDELPPGWYRAHFDVFAAGLPLTSRSLTLIRLAARLGGDDAAARCFGVVLDSDLSAADAELHLLRHLLARSVKIPVWMETTGDGPEPAPRPDMDRFLQELVKKGFALTAVFAGPPPELSKNDVYVQSLLEVLAGDRGAWSEPLAAVVAPHAGTFRWWQLGTEENPLSPDADHLVSAVTNLREAMSVFVTAPRFSIPLSVAAPRPSVTLPVQQVNVVVNPDMNGRWLADAIGAYRKAGYETVSAFVPSPREAYERTAELSRWTRQILELRHAGADTVFIPQPWHAYRSESGTTIEPEESFLMMRTIADVIAQSEPGPRLNLADGVTALAFHDGPESTLALWDLSAPKAGRSFAFQLGRAGRVIDLWGNVQALSRDEQGRQVIELSAMPVLVDGVERWLTEFVSSIALTPERVESGRELVTHEVRLDYSGTKPISGEVRLEAPEDWSISPRTFSFHVSSQRAFVQEVQIRYSHRELAGRKGIAAHVALSGEGYSLEIPLHVEIGLSDMEVSGLGLMEGEDVLLRHTITNRSSQTLSFRGSADVPERERQYRPISELHPGDTQVVEYRFKGARALSGKEARLMLKELGDGPRIHNLRVVIP